MLIDRRGFMQGAALIAAGNVLSPSSDIRSDGFSKSGFRTDRERRNWDSSRSCIQGQWVGLSRRFDRR